MADINLTQEEADALMAMENGGSMNRNGCFHLLAAALQFH